VFFERVKRKDLSGLPVSNYTWSWTAQDSNIVTPSSVKKKRF